MTQALSWFSKTKSFTFVHKGRRKYWNWTMHYRLGDRLFGCEILITIPTKSQIKYELWVHFTVTDPGSWAQSAPGLIVFWDDLTTYKTNHPLQESVPYQINFIFSKIFLAFLVHFVCDWEGGFKIVYWPLKSDHLRGARRAGNTLIQSFRARKKLPDCLKTRIRRVHPNPPGVPYNSMYLQFVSQNVEKNIETAIEYRQSLLCQFVTELSRIESLTVDDQISRLQMESPRSRISPIRRPRRLSSPPIHQSPCSERSRTV